MSAPKARKNARGAPADKPAALQPPTLDAVLCSVCTRAAGAATPTCSSLLACRNTLDAKGGELSVLKGQEQTVFELTDDDSPLQQFAVTNNQKANDIKLDQYNDAFFKWCQQKQCHVFYVGKDGYTYYGSLLKDLDKDGNHRMTRLEQAVNEFDFKALMEILCELDKTVHLIANGKVYRDPKIITLQDDIKDRAIGACEELKCSECGYNAITHVFSQQRLMYGDVDDEGNPHFYCDTCLPWDSTFTLNGTLNFIFKKACDEQTSFEQRSEMVGRAMQAHVQKNTVVKDAELDWGDDASDKCESDAGIDCEDHASDAGSNSGEEKPDSEDESDAIAAEMQREVTISAYGSPVTPESEDEADEVLADAPSHSKKRKAAGSEKENSTPASFSLDAHQCQGSVCADEVDHLPDRWNGVAGQIEQPSHSSKAQRINLNASRDRPIQCQDEECVELAKKRKARGDEQRRTRSSHGSHDTSEERAGKASQKAPVRAQKASDTCLWEDGDITDREDSEENSDGKAHGVQRSDEPIEERTALSQKAPDDTEKQIGSDENSTDSDESSDDEAQHTAPSQKAPATEKGNSTEDNEAHQNLVECPSQAEQLIALHKTRRAEKASDISLWEDEHVTDREDSEESSDAKARGVQRSDEPIEERTALSQKAPEDTEKQTGSDENSTDSDESSDDEAQHTAPSQKAPATEKGNSKEKLLNFLKELRGGNSLQPRSNIMSQKAAPQGELSHVGTFKPLVEHQKKQNKHVEALQKQTNSRNPFLTGARIITQHIQPKAVKIADNFLKNMGLGLLQDGHLTWTDEQREKADAIFDNENSWKKEFEQFAKTLDKETNELLLKGTTAMQTEIETVQDDTRSTWWTQTFFALRNRVDIISGEKELTSKWIDEMNKHSFTMQNPQ